MLLLFNTEHRKWLIIISVNILAITIILIIFFDQASFLTIKRIIKCHPFAKMKYDPVPEERKYQHKWKTLEESMNDYYYKNLYK